MKFTEKGSIEVTAKSINRGLDISITDTGIGIKGEDLAKLFEPFVRLESPLSLIDAAFSLGSSIATASGFNRKGIAIVGDFGLAHSGMAGLTNAVHNKHELVIVVLQNEVAAMTGGQEVPDLTGLVSSYIKDTEIIDPQDANLKNKLLKKLKKKGISVLLAKAPCPRY